jgi:DNA-binding response OmpR family regulator
MSSSKERILIVEGDLETSDLIARQALKPLGYQVKVIHEAPMAIQEAIRFVPDILIVNLNLPGLSGKDLLVALSSQGMYMPAIVIAEEGMEGDVIQAFRLGASDYLSWPIRETEVVSAVERALIQVRADREREQLSRKVERTNKELSSRVRELTTIMGIGKAVTSITDRHALFDKIIEGAVFLAEADKGWLLLRDGDSKTFKLSAQRNLPKSIADKINFPWDDGISSLVALSGESLSIHGPPLRRLRASRLGKSVLVVPVKIKKEVVGLLVVMRNEPKPFNPSNRTLLETLADYASISLVNVKLFQAVEERARSLMLVAESARDSEKAKSEILLKVNKTLETSLASVSQNVNLLAEDQEQPLSDDQMALVRLVREQLDRILVAKNGMVMLQQAHSPKKTVTVSLVDLARDAVERFQQAAGKNAVTIEMELPPEPILVAVDIDQLGLVIDALLSNAIRVSIKGRVVLSIRKDKSGKPHVSVQDTGPGIPAKHHENIFNPFFKLESSHLENLDNLGIGLALGKEIVKSHGGEIWVESHLGEGSTFHFVLKAVY